MEINVSNAPPINKLKVLRVFVQGIPLIDPAASISYKSSLMNFEATHKKTVVRMAPLKRLIV